MKHTIKIVHSKFGVCRLLMNIHAYSKDHKTIKFYYPDETFMGEWDDNQGGGLNHPIERTQSSGAVFLEEDERAYIELEDLLYEVATIHYPYFFDAEHVKWRAELAKKKKW